MKTGYNGTLMKIQDINICRKPTHPANVSRHFCNRTVRYPRLIRFYSIHRIGSSCLVALITYGYQHDNKH
jgi:hypothetical protein